ncbi:hypothetical protein GCM10009843_04040 [Nocardioides bigeumensis]|uniref:Uncharacterized protein n=1 Tax=Nocardioides bigeumensis TaxID=433657 RepID=A0ABN2XRA6_9ACTN
MAGPSGLPADSVRDDLDPSSRGGYTSPTDIGGYLWRTAAVTTPDSPGRSGRRGKGGLERAIAG